MKSIAKEFGVICGIGLIVLSVAAMTTIHEYEMSGLVFIVGILVFGVAYATLPNDKKIPVNTDKINQNLQSLNDVLWGMSPKEKVIAGDLERYWADTIRYHCDDRKDEHDVIYCCYGGKRGYCAYRTCPRGAK